MTPGVEQRESTADVAFWRKVRDGPIQYRRGTVEDDAEKRKDREHRREREHQGRYHQQCGCGLRGDHTPHHAEMLAKPAAGRLAERSPDEEQREAQTDDRLRSAAGVQEKRQEQQIAHPRRRIERADDEE